jgi:hypothetical protein
MRENLIRSLVINELLIIQTSYQSTVNSGESATCVGPDVSVSCALLLYLCDGDNWYRY